MKTSRSNMDTLISGIAESTGFRADRLGLYTIETCDDMVKLLTKKGFDGLVAHNFSHVTDIGMEHTRKIGNNWYNVCKTGLWNEIMFGDDKMVFLMSIFKDKESHFRISPIGKNGHVNLGQELDKNEFLDSVKQHFGW